MPPREIFLPFKATGNKLMDHINIGDRVTAQSPSLKLTAPCKRHWDQQLIRQDDDRLELLNSHSHLHA